MTSFWEYFEQEAEPNLGKRAVSFRKIFEYLDTFETPITIVETGCLRQPGNYIGDGQSSLLFDRYVSDRGNGSHTYPVDLDPVAVKTCAKLVSSNTTVTCSDSVAYLNSLAEEFINQGTPVHLVYLDSYDVDWTYWFPSAAHHLKELAVVQRFIDSETLVVVDDCGATGLLFGKDNGQYDIFLETLTVGGKGRLVAEFATQIGVTPLFNHYQVGWIGFGNKVDD